MRNYTPRRAGKRWLENAPDFILDCFDNKGNTCDRYTVMFGKQLMNTVRGYPGGDHWIQYLGMSGAPTHPQGFSQWGELAAHQAAAYRYRSGHQRVRWMDLPEHIRLHVLVRALDEVPVQHRRTRKTGVITAVRSDMAHVTVKWDENGESSLVKIGDTILYPEKEAA